MENDYLLGKPDKWDSTDFVRCPYCQELTAYPGRWAEQVQCLVCNKLFGNPALKEDYIQLEEEQIDVLRGLYHLCPLCFSQLSYRSMPNANECHWFCKSCGTEWLVGELIAALNNNELEEE